MFFYFIILLIRLRSPVKIMFHTKEYSDLHCSKKINSKDVKRHNEYYIRRLKFEDVRSKTYQGVKQLEHLDSAL